MHGEERGIRTYVSSPSCKHNLKVELCGSALKLDAGLADVAHGRAPRGEAKLLG